MKLECVRFWYSQDLSKYVNKQHIKREQIQQIIIEPDRQGGNLVLYYWVE